MTDEVINAGSPADEGTAPVEDKAGTTGTDEGEQLATSEDGRSKEELKAELEATKKSADEYRAMNDRRGTEAADKIKDMESKMNQILEGKASQEKAAQDSNYAATLDKLREVYKRDPLEAMMLIVKADRMTAQGNAPKADPTIAQLKVEKLVSTGLSKLGIDVPKDAIYEIIGELGMNAGNEMAIKTAVEIYKGRNIDKLAGTGAPVKTPESSISHNVAAPTSAGEVVKITDTDKKHVAVGIDRKVFENLADYNKYVKEFGELKKGEGGGYIIEDRDYKDAKITVT